MSEQPDRPETLGRRRGPRPAADELIDPVDTVPAAKPPAPAQPAPVESAPVPKVATRQVTVQLGVRIDVDIANDLSRHVAYKGGTQRKVIEAALKLYMAHHEMAAQVTEEAARRNVDPAQIIEEAVRAHLG